LDQQVSKVGVDAPIAHRVGVGQGVARNAAPNTHVIELGLIGTQTSFDIAQAFAIRQLGKGHAEKLIPTGEALEFVVATITFDAFLKLEPGEVVRQLRKDRFAAIH